MANGCVARGCKNRPSKNISGISYHRFPLRKQLQNVWLKAIGRENWKPSKSSRLCSLHFKKSDIVGHCSGRTFLKDGAVPISLSPEHLPKKSKPEHLHFKKVKVKIEQEVSSTPDDLSEKRLTPLVPTLPVSASSSIVKTSPVSTSCSIVQTSPVSNSPLIIQTSPVLTLFSIVPSPVLTASSIVQTSSVSTSSSIAQPSLVSTSSSVIQTSSVSKSPIVQNSPVLTSSPIVQTAPVLASSPFVLVANPNSFVPTTPALTSTSVNPTPLSISTDFYERKLANLKTKYRQKIKVLNDKVKRHQKKITDLYSIIADLKRELMLKPEAVEKLQKIADSNNKDLIIRHLSKVNPLFKQKYSQELKAFALTLYNYSPRAYDYVRNTFKRCLPHSDTLSKWYQKEDESTGFTEEAFKALEGHTKQKHPIVCTLIVDGMEMEAEKQVKCEAENECG